MRILYLHQFFRTPAQAGITRSYTLARALVERGHDVHLITSAAGSAFSSVPAARRKQQASYTIDGITVHPLRVPYDNAYGVGARGRAFARYAVQAYAKALMLPRPDLTYATSTPLTVGLPALWLKRSRGVPYLLELRDLWPDFPWQMGALRGPGMVAAARALERRLYRQAAARIALSPGIAAGIGRTLGFSEGTLPHTFATDLLPNFSDTALFTPDGDAATLPELQPHERAIVYAGALGRANNLYGFLDVARVAAAAKRPYRFYMIGEGSERSALQALCATLPNAHVLPPVPKQQLPTLLRAAHLCCTAFLPLTVLETTSPNKFFDGLAMGRPVWVTVQGWLQDLVETHGCGFYAPTSAPEVFLAKADALFADNAAYAEACVKARALAVARFSSVIAGQSVVEIVERRAGALGINTSI